MCPFQKKHASFESLLVSKFKQGDQEVSYLSIMGNTMDVQTKAARMETRKLERLINSPDIEPAELDY